MRKTHPKANWPTAMKKHIKKFLTFVCLSFVWRPILMQSPYDCSRTASSEGVSPLYGDHDAGIVFRAGASPRLEFVFRRRPPWSLLAVRALEPFWTWNQKSSQDTRRRWRMRGWESLWTWTRAGKLTWRCNSMWHVSGKISSPILHDVGGIPVQAAKPQKSWRA